MRGLLCVSQSSKERLRRSRTESSGAAPAIEELAGEARQVRPAGPRADQYQPGSDFSRAKRSGGRQALQLPRPSNPRRSSALPPSSRPRTTGVGNSRLGTVLLPPKRSGGRPALQLLRASNSRGSSTFYLCRDRVPQKSEFFASLLFPFMNQNITGRSHREYHGLEPGVRAGRFLHNASGAVAEHFPAE